MSIYDYMLDRLESPLRKSLEKNLVGYDVNVDKIVVFWKKVTGFLISVFLGMSFIWTMTVYLPKKGLATGTITNIILCMIFLALINKK